MSLTTFVHLHPTTTTITATLTSAIRFPKPFSYPGRSSNFRHVSLHVMESKGVLNSGFQWNLDLGFHRWWDSGFFELYLEFQGQGFQIPRAKITRIPYSLTCGDKLLLVVFRGCSLKESLKCM